jgi:hypothetical protein
MMHGNCWAYALLRWKYRQGQYLIVRKSKYTFWPHCMMADSIKTLEVEEFKPVKPQRGWTAWIRAIWFEGRVRRGIGEE